MTLDNLIKKAEEAGSYFLTLTIKDNSKDKNNLNHYTVQQEFSLDDIVPSIDASLRSMKKVPMESPEPTLPPKIEYKEKKPLKIAILSHFNRAPESYSPARAVKNQVKMLVERGHKVVFFTQEKSTLDLGCEMRPLVPKFKREKGVVNEDIKKKFIDILREELTSDFDVAITHDFFIQDCITYREAIKECGVPIKWLHFARSGVAEYIKWDMPNAHYVCLNYADIGILASHVGTTTDKIRTVFNEKDPSFMFRWHPTTKMIVDRFRLWDKDIIQTYPICSSRFDAKGLDSVMKIFGLLKQHGKKVALIICNSNGRKRVEELKAKQALAVGYGLSSEDFIFTSLLSDEEHDTSNEVPNQVAAELMQISNLFIFPTIAEAGPNVLLEASMTKNLLVLNEDLPCLFDFADKNAVLKWPFTSRQSIHYAGRDNDSMKSLVKQIIGQIESNKADKQFRFVWRNHNADSIYYNMLRPVLYENI